MNRLPVEELKAGTRVRVAGDIVSVVSVTPAHTTDHLIMRFQTDSGRQHAVVRLVGDEVSVLDPPRLDASPGVDTGG